MGYHSNLNTIGASTFFAVSQGFITYDINENKWNIKDKEILKNVHGSCCYDPISKQIFIVRDHSLKLFNHQTKKLSKFLFAKDMAFSKTIWMDSACHIIGGQQSNSHQIWIAKIKRLRDVYSFNDYGQCFGLFGLVRVRRTKELLLFGGLTPSQRQDHDMIHKYSLSTAKWEKLNIKLPQKMHGFGCVITKCQRYVIMMGGSGGYDQEFYRFDRYDRIFILKLKDMKFRE